VPLTGILVALLAFLLVLGGADTAQAQTFDLTIELTIDNPEPEGNSEFTTDLILPDGDVNFAGLVAFVPGDWGVVPADEIPIGAIVGELTSQATLGLFNNACNNVLPVRFTFLNSSIDTSDTVPFDDTDGDNIEEWVEDNDQNGLPDAFDKYPEFITRVLVDENDRPLQPIRRSAGITIVAGINVLLQFLIFEPGTFIDEELPNDEELGYPTVILLQNAGDPESDPEPSPINDFCTPLLSSNTTFAISKDNPCTDNVPLDELDPICEKIGATFEIPEVGGTVPDEAGHVLFVNPQEGTYTFTTIAFGLRDADGDGYENFLDTCPLDPNEGNPRVGGDGDADEDGLDAACDPDDSVTNSDEDLDGYVNRQDNCPLVANGQDETNQADKDLDQIGDVCDPDPDDAELQGELLRSVVTADVIIGTGEGPGGPPSGFESGGDGGGGDGDGGLSTGAIIGIIIGVIAAVIVVGGGAFYVRRRGSGGGGAAA